MRKGDSKAVIVAIKMNIEGKEGRGRPKNRRIIELRMTIFPKKIPFFDLTHNIYLIIII